MGLIKHEKYGKKQKTKENRILNRLRNYFSINHYFLDCETIVLHFFFNSFGENVAFYGDAVKQLLKVQSNF